MSNITYHATSLEDIAKMFDAMAADASKKQAGARTVKEGKHYAGEHYAWTAAAEILRQTALNGTKE